MYPGEEGPVESIRLEVLQEAMQDLRALQLLESLVGRERVLELIEEGLEGVGQLGDQGGFGRRRLSGGGDL